MDPGIIPGMFSDKAVLKVKLMDPHVALIHLVGMLE